MEISLDARYSPSENAQRYYRRYKKLKRLRIVAQGRREEAAQELAFLEGLLFDLEEARSGEDLAPVEAACEAAGYGEGLAPDAPEKRGRRAAAKGAPALPYRRFRTAQGWEIFVGKNAMGNDALIRRVGREGDIWLHAQGLPGSHVLLRAPEGGSRPGRGEEEAALLRAAALAAHYSRGRGSGKLAVDWAPYRRVRRPRGARPGQVVFTGQRTVMVPPAGAEDLEETG
ncbi:MAG: NFACT RNA binding domain-containing protein [bacterium]